MLYAGPGDHSSAVHTKSVVGARLAGPWAFRVAASLAASPDYEGLRRHIGRRHGLRRMDDPAP
jgi:hypothetical protein